MAKKSKSGAGKKKGGKSAAQAELLAAIAQTARAARGDVARRLLASGLYAGQDAVISLLDGEGTHTPSGIALALGVRPPTVTKTINRLAAQGFVTKSASATDGRMATIALTEAGRAAALSVRAAHAESRHAACDGLAGKEIKALVRLLHQVDANLKSACDAGTSPPDAAPD